MAACVTLRNFMKAEPACQQKCDMTYNPSSEGSEQVGDLGLFGCDWVGKRRWRAFSFAVPLGIHLVGLGLDTPCVCQEIRSSNPEGVDPHIAERAFAAGDNGLMPFIGHRVSTGHQRRE